MDTKITVEGMSCGHCKMSVEKAALSVANVERAVVSLENKELSITVTSDDNATVTAVKDAVKEAGFEVK